MRTLRTPALRGFWSAAALTFAAASLGACQASPSGTSSASSASSTSTASTSVSAPSKLTGGAAPEPGAPANPSPGPPGRPAPPSGAPAASAAPADNEATPLQILRLTFTSNVREKEPVDKLEAAKPGQRVWAHVNFRNRTGSSREVDLVFRVNGKERSRVPLEIQSSWSYRTWGYVTLRAADTSGDVTVTVIDDSGDELSSARIPIRL